MASGTRNLTIQSVSGWVEILPAGIGGTVGVAQGSVALWRSESAPGADAIGWIISTAGGAKQYSRAAETNATIKLWGKAIGDHAILIIDEN